MDKIEGTFLPLKNRRIRLDTCKQYGFRCAIVDSDSHLYVADYHDAHGVQCQHVKSIEDNFYYWNGKYSGAKLFGQQNWQAGGKRVVVAKGEIDTLTISQAFQLKWPVVGVPGCDQAYRWIKRNLEWVDSFDEVVLAFDDTEAGQKAVEDVGTMFRPGKIKVMSYGGHKDANDMLLQNAGDRIAKQVWQARDYRPDGIVMGYELWDDILSEPPVGYSIPFPVLQKKMDGIRKGRIVLLTAGSGLGKSTFAHELGYHLLMEHGLKLGVMGLEEPRKRLAERYIAMDLNKKIHIRREGISEEELRKAYDNTINSDRFCLFDHRGSKDIRTLLSKIRYMVVGLGMDFIILDHISIVVSGLNDMKTDERKTIDMLMTELSSMVEELEFGLIAIVHLRRKNDGSKKSYNEGRPVSLSDLRGSGGLEQMSHVVISLERNQQDEELKDYSQLRLLKDRDLGDSGLVDVIHYNRETGRMQASEHNPFEDKTKKEENPFLQEEF